MQGIKKETPDEVVDYLDPTKDGEASEKAHCASYQTQLGFHCHLKIFTKLLKNHLLIPLNLIVGCRVKVDVYRFKRCMLQQRNWIYVDKNMINFDNMI